MSKGQNTQITTTSYRKNTYYIITRTVSINALSENWVVNKSKSTQIRTQLIITAENNSNKGSFFINCRIHNLKFKSWKLSIIYASGKTLEDLQILTLGPILIRGKCTKINLNVSTNYFEAPQIDRCNQKQISFLGCPLKKTYEKCTKSYI